MKKIFLIISIAIFASASAQQTDVFDIQKYLEKKSSEEKKAITNPPSKILKPVIETIDENLWTLANGNKAMSLSQDNMPCVVPDMSAFNMPVVKPGMSQYNIPNPVYPLQSKILPLPFKQLKGLLEKKGNK